eukprot:768665-Hanusia_phi.AAC.6
MGGLKAESGAKGTAGEGKAVSLRHHTLEQRLLFTNRSDVSVLNFSCKAAVPKYMQVQQGEEGEEEGEGGRGGGRWERRKDAGIGAEEEAKGGNEGEPQVQITPPTNSTIAPGGEVSQTLRIAGVDKTKAIKVRLKVEFTGSDGAIGKPLVLNFSSSNLFNYSSPPSSPVASTSPQPSLPALLFALVPSACFLARSSASNPFSFLSSPSLPPSSLPLLSVSPSPIPSLLPPLLLSLHPTDETVDMNLT